MADKRVAIGELRWPFTLVTRVQAPAADGYGITETSKPADVIWGRIENTYAATYWGIEGAQVERPITHMIWVRWRPYLDNTYALQRSRENLDGTVRTETFRIRRVAEVDQKSWICRLECEQENVQ